MVITEKLASRVYRSIDHDYGAIPAFQVSYNGVSFTWSISDGVFLTTVVGGSGVGLSVSLSGFESIAVLCTYLNSQPGYTITPVQDQSVLACTPFVLIDGSSGLSGDSVAVYGAEFWILLAAFAAVLREARDAILAMPLEMVISYADGYWLDVLGGFYGIQRIGAEVDAFYRKRIIVEVLRPRGNNVAIAVGIANGTGIDYANIAVTDASTFSINTPPRYNEFYFDGSVHYGDSVVTLSAPCLFDVTISNESVDATKAAQISRIVDQFRDAGCLVRLISAAGSCGFYFDGTVLMDGSDCYGQSF